MSNAFPMRRPSQPILDCLAIQICKSLTHKRCKCGHVWQMVQPRRLSNTMTTTCYVKSHCLGIPFKTVDCIIWQTPCTSQSHLSLAWPVTNHEPTSQVFLPAHAWEEDPQTSQSPDKSAIAFLCCKKTADCLLWAARCSSSLTIRFYQGYMRQIWASQHTHNSLHQHRSGSSLSALLSLLLKHCSQS